MGSNKGGSTQTTDEEKQASHLETAGKDALKPAYYNRNGLRVDSDSEDHDHEPPVSRSSCSIHSHKRWAREDEELMRGLTFRVR